jgi:tetratricopeptide (TPR) repeat protein
MKTLYVGILLAFPSAIFAQSLLTLPEASPRAAVTQRVGLVDVTISYHRPLAAGRKIWGGIVPYGEVWRAGANENTLIAVSDAVTIDGQPLAKGTYGLHMQPSADSWKIIFSRNTTSWGSYCYRESEDAVRVTVKPESSEFHEALVYEFDDIKPESAVANLRWEKLSVPFRIAVDESATLDSLRAQLRGGVQYLWEGWLEAATYCADKKVNLEEALGWSNRSIQNEERFENLEVKSRLLKLLNREPEAKVAMDRALAVASAPQLYYYGRHLQATGRTADAMALFQDTAQRYPDHWLAHLAKARLNSAKGNYDAAAQEIRAILAMDLPAPQKANLEKLAQSLDSKQDINR